MDDNFRRGLLTGFLFYREFPLRRLFRFLRIFIYVGNCTLAFATVSANTPHFLMVSFRTFQSVMIGRGPRVQFVGPRARDSHDRGSFRFFRRRVVLVLHPHR